MSKAKNSVLNAIDFREFGECPVNIDLVVTLWNTNCYIYKGEDYRLTEYRDLENGHKRRRFTVTISQADAIELIQRLHLNYYPISALGGHYGLKDPNIHGWFE